MNPDLALYAPMLCASTAGSIVKVDGISINIIRKKVCFM